jgi:autoinducer 2-degrading protein
MTQDTSVAVTYVIRFHVDPEKIAIFSKLLNGVLDAMRSESNFRQAILHRDPVADNRFMLYETWEDHDEVVEVQLKRPYRRAWHEALPEMLIEPREMSIWHPLRADFWRATW